MACIRLWDGRRRLATGLAAAGPLPVLSKVERALWAGRQRRVRSACNSRSGRRQSGGLSLEEEVSRLQSASGTAAATAVCVAARSGSDKGQPLQRQGRSWSSHRAGRRSGGGGGGTTRRGMLQLLR